MVASKFKQIAKIMQIENFSQLHHAAAGYAALLHDYVILTSKFYDGYILRT